MKATMKSIRQVAELLNVSEFRIAYAHRTGKLPEPMRVAGKRIYSAVEIAAVKKYFQSKKEAE